MEEDLHPVVDALGLLGLGDAADGDRGGRHGQEHTAQLLTHAKSCRSGWDQRLQSTLPAPAGPELPAMGNLIEPDMFI
ncbi:hypothetical protein GCM10027589_06070 [Actinocorallia lasiicapitis]